MDELGLVEEACNPGYFRGETEGRQVQSQLREHRKTLSQDVNGEGLA